MESLHTTANGALREILASQPTSEAKVVFAWRMAAGPALARATEATFRDDGILVIRARTDAWQRELRHAKPMLVARLHALLGERVVKRLVIQ
jgi:hypothetical protein